MPSLKVCDSAIATPTRRKSLANKEPMPVHERAVVDAALAILERYMAVPKRRILETSKRGTRLSAFNVGCRATRGIFSVVL